MTADDLVARFVPVGGATFTDAFTIHRGDPPPNSAPTARFTSTTDGLTAAFDGRGSGDAEGPVAAWSWDFGDGAAPASGAQPSHAYAAAGTYPVTLTVTDGAGATARVTNPVTVTAPAPGPVDFVLDSFGRTVSGGWGSADVGGPWTTSGTAANFAVAGGSGLPTFPAAGTTRAVWMGGPTRTSTDLRLTLRWTRCRPGTALPRRGGSPDQRHERVPGPHGHVLDRADHRPADRAAGDVRAGGSRAGGEAARDGHLWRRHAVHVRLQVTGTDPTTIRLKVWPAGATEPAAWQTTATDSTAALQGAGAIGLSGYLSGSVTNAPVVLRLDDLSARPAA